MAKIWSAAKTGNAAPISILVTGAVMKMVSLPFTTSLPSGTNELRSLPLAMEADMTGFADFWVVSQVIEQAQTKEGLGAADWREPTRRITLPWKIR